MAARRDARVWLALVTVYIVWGSTFIALAIAVRDLPPYLAMATRHLVAGAALLAFALPRGERADDPIGRKQVGAASCSAGCSSSSGTARSRGRSRRFPQGSRPCSSAASRSGWRLLDRVAFGRRLHPSAYVGFALGFVGLAFLVRPVRRRLRRPARSARHRPRARSAGRPDRSTREAHRLPKRPLVSAGPRLPLRWRSSSRDGDRDRGARRRALLARRATRSRLPRRRRDLRRLHRVCVAAPRRADLPRRHVRVRESDRRGLPRLGAARGGDHGADGGRPARWSSSPSR